jgi:hypothetical protein
MKSREDEIEELVSLGNSMSKINILKESNMIIKCNIIKINHSPHLLKNSDSSSTNV